jgi:coenzyme F420-reducing hydrogenase beta subunit
MVDSVLADRIAYTIGLFCGHLKTKKYCAYLSRCCGVREGQARTVNFRKKVPDYPANKYAFEVSLEDNGGQSHRQIMMADVWANNWSYNLFMLDACEYCDDVVAETADVSVGDAWLPECIQDYRGTSIIVCRHRDMLSLLNSGAENGEVSLKEISIDKVIQSQASCIRQRREGLKYRLYLSGKKGLWRPSKRVNADRKTLSVSYRLLQLLRIKTKTLSREAFLKQQPVDGIDVFVKLLKPWILLSRTLNFARHIPGIIRRRMIKLLKMITS